MRAFVALDLPPEAVSKIERVIASLKGALGMATPSRAKVRWVRPGQAHLTLRFLGEVRPSQVESVIEDMRQALRSKEGYLDLRFGRAGAFPSPSRARVLWVALDGSEDQLLEIADIAETAAQRAGLEPSNRQFRPHVTLARIQPPMNVSGLLASLRTDRDSWQGEVVSVIRSDLTRKGPEYSRLAQFDLSGDRATE